MDKQYLQLALFHSTFIISAHTHWHPHPHSQVREAVSHAQAHRSLEPHIVDDVERMLLSDLRAMEGDFLNISHAEHAVQVCAIFKEVLCLSCARVCIGLCVSILSSSHLSQCHCSEYRVVFSRGIIFHTFL